MTTPLNQTYRLTLEDHNGTPIDTHDVTLYEGVDGWNLMNAVQRQILIITLVSQIAKDQMDALTMNYDENQREKANES
jgi:hypothetical protein